MDPLQQKLSPFITFPFLGVCLAFVIFLHFMVSKATNTQVDLVVGTQQSYTDNGRFATLYTTEGEIVIEFLKGYATTTISSFIRLSENGFYDGTKFHRVIAGFMIQGGDPFSRGDDVSMYGKGGPGYLLLDEINEVKLRKGIVAMANAGPDTNGSQFFIVTADATPWLDGRHTAFARVVEGMSTVQAIERVKTDRNDVPLESITLRGVRIE